MKLFFLGLVAALALAVTPASAQQPNVNPALATVCQQSAIYDASTSGATLLVTGNATSRIYVCGYVFFAAGTANVDLVYGTGSTCGGSTTKITPAFQLTAQTGLVDHPSFYAGLTPAPVSNNLCINTSAGVAVQAIVYYAQF